MDPTKLPLLLSVKTTAAALDMSKQQVYRILHAGKFGDDWETFPRTQGQLRIPRDRVLKYAQVDISAPCSGSKTEAPA